MAILVNSSFTLDESAAFQTPDTDDTGNDFAYTTLPSTFRQRLFDPVTDGGLNLSPSFPDAVGVGQSAANFLTISGGGGTLSGVQFYDGSGGALDGDWSGLYTLSDRKIFLYADSANPRIVYGREGTAGGIADPSGTIVLSLYLDLSSDSTAAKVWSVLLEPLRHPDGTNPDDFLDLGGYLTVGAVSTDNYIFAGAPSGQNLFMAFSSSNNPTNAIVVTGRAPADQSTGVNISTGDTVNTGKGGGATTLGTNDQGIKPGAGMYFTYVTGMNSSYVASTSSGGLDQNEADVEANIAFTGLQAATSASFSVVQISGNSTADIRITATSTAAEPGVNFVDGLTNDTTVDITSYKVMLGTADITSSITAQNLSGFGAIVLLNVPVGAVVTYTTTDPHNRVLIENARTGVNDKSFDIGSFQVANAQNFSAEVGAAIRFDDSGPTLTLPAVTSENPDGGDLYVGNLTSGIDSATLDFNKGSDVEGATFRITDAPGNQGDATSGWNYIDVTGDNVADLNAISGKFGDGGSYTLIVDQASGVYTVDVVTAATADPEHLDTADIKAGGPGTNWIDVGLFDSDNFVRIAGYYDSNGDTVEPPPAPAAINESNLNVGVRNGNLDAGESLHIKIVTYDPTPGQNGDEQLEDISAINIGTKTPKGTLYKYELYNDGVKVFDTDEWFTSTNGTVAVGKNGTLRLVDWEDGDMFDFAVVTSVNGDAVKIGLRDLTIERQPPDFSLPFTIDLIDGDDDVSSSVNFTVFVDGNNDNNYSVATSSLAMAAPWDLLAV
jgi:hypothetical protein